MYTYIHRKRKRERESKREGVGGKWKRKTWSSSNTCAFFLACKRTPHITSALERRRFAGRAHTHAHQAPVRTWHHAHAHAHYIIKPARAAWQSEATHSTALFRMPSPTCWLSVLAYWSIVNLSPMKLSCAKSVLMCKKSCDACKKCMQKALLCVKSALLRVTNVCKKRSRV